MRAAGVGGRRMIKKHLASLSVCLGPLRKDERMNDEDTESIRKNQIYFFQKSLKTEQIRRRTKKVTTTKHTKEFLCECASVQCCRRI